jgi:hypothetical protein
MAFAAPGASPAVSNIVPPEPDIGDSVAETPISLVRLLGIMHTADLIC